MYFDAPALQDFLRSHIRTVPDWPKPGVQFRDITTLLQNPLVFRVIVDTFVQRYLADNRKPTAIAALDARGFIFGAAVAYCLNISFVPIRKLGKLPFDTVKESFSLEYGEATVELHTDALKANDKVVLMDDLIATGGTMLAGKRLIERLGASVLECAVVIDLPDLGGSKLLSDAGVPVCSLLSYGGH